MASQMRKFGHGKRRWPATRPVVLEVKTDPNVPPLPPHITLAQAKAFTSLLTSGFPRQSVSAMASSSVW